MNENIYLEKLAWFKQNEKPEAVLFVAENTERIHLLIAWTNIQTKIAENPTELKGTSESEIWEWLWENTMYSRNDFIAKTGISLTLSGLEKKLMPLIGNRIIYPDGTVNSYVQRYLREKVIRLFESKTRKLPNK
jgi:hypothetical protein